METLLQDVRFGLRMLLKSPCFTAVAVFTLALGIGVTTAVFSLVDNVLLKMLPVKEPEQLLLFANVGGFSDTFSYPHYKQFRDQNQVFFGVTGFALTDLDVTVDGKAELVQGQFVSGNYFSVLEVSTILGRPITDEDDRVPSGHPVAVISAGYWQRKFGGDPSALGRTITLQGYPFTVIGILPHEFFGLEVGNSPDISILIMMRSQLDQNPSYLNDPGISWLQIVARRKPWVSHAEAQASASVIYQQLKDDTLRSLPPGIPPQLKQMILETKLELKSASQGLNHLRNRFSRPLLILMVAAGTMLLIACSNVANLMLARSTARRKEFAVRLAIGAGRRRLIQQLLTESLLLATMGGLLGLLMAHWISHFLVALVSSGSTPVLLNLHLDYRLLSFAAAASLLTAVIFGLGPALGRARVSLTEALKHQKGRPDRIRHRAEPAKLLVITQVALSVVLVIGAGLLFRTLQNLRNVEAGFNRDNLLLFSLNPSSAGYKDRRLATCYAQLREQLATIPGIISASFSRYSPVGGNYWINIVSLDGYTPRPDEDMQVEVNLISPEFFKTLGIPLLLGRPFSPQDHESSPKVAIINEAMAHHYFGNDNPIGKRIGFGHIENSGQIEIVGLAKDVKYGHLRDPVKRMVYVPYLQEMLSEMTFSVRTQGNPLGIVSQIRRQVEAIDKTLPIFGIKTLHTQIEESLVQERMVGTLLDGSGMFGLLMACMGLYGLLSYTVAKRTNEIGIRMALGAKPRDVLKLVLGQGLTLTLLGVLLGLAAAVGLTRFLGKRIMMGAPMPERPWLTIVGVAGDVRNSGLETPPLPQMYAPFLQNPTRSMTLVISTALAAQTLTTAIQHQVIALDKDLPIYDVKSMEQRLSNSVAQPRFRTLLLAIFAVLALVLSAVGIYGVMSYSTQQRTHEIGIRIALGAQTGDVLKLVVRQGMVLTQIGVVIGLGLSFALTRFLSSLLFGVSATDPGTFVAVSVLLATVALVACYIPARRATKVDPIVALRYE